jgi:hypothetical protein
MKRKSKKMKAIPRMTLSGGRMGHAWFSGGGSNFTGGSGFRRSNEGIFKSGGFR